MALAALVAAAAPAGNVRRTLAGEGPGREQAAVPVTAAVAAKKAVPFELGTFGNVEANVTVAVKPQVTGVLTAVHFKEGEAVIKEARLFSIDPRPFQAELDRAEANLARDQAQLNNAKAEAKRQADLFATGGVSEGARDQARAAADALEAAVRADQAAVQTARLNKEYCSVTSPIEGRAGACLADAGNMVKAGDAALVVINQVRPIQMSFTVPQQNLAEIRKRLAAGKLEVRTYVPGQAQPETGELTFVDNAVDRATGTVRLKATFANTAERLWPGQFVTVKLVLYVQPDAVVVPSQAVQSGQQGQFVYVVKADGKVESRIVTVDRILGDESIVSKGVQAGEQVVTDGQLRLFPDAKVTIKPEPGAPGPGRPGPEKTDPPKAGAKSGGAPRA
jgi:multidrug efflux system membrane fusion protein